MFSNVRNEGIVSNENSDRPEITGLDAITLVAKKDDILTITTTPNEQTPVYNK